MASHARVQPEKPTRATPQADEKKRAQHFWTHSKTLEPSIPALAPTLCPHIPRHRRSRSTESKESAWIDRSIRTPALALPVRTRHLNRQCRLPHTHTTPTHDRRPRAYDCCTFGPRDPAHLLKSIRCVACLDRLGGGIHPGGSKPASRARRFSACCRSSSVAWGRVPGRRPSRVCCPWWWDAGTPRPLSQSR